jgi:hypothetical protein
VLVEQWRAGGFGHLIAFTDFRKFTMDDLIRSHRLIGTEVASLVRSAGVCAAARSPEEETR